MRRAGLGARRLLAHRDAADRVLRGRTALEPERRERQAELTPDLAQAGRLYQQIYELSDRSEAYGWQAVERYQLAGKGAEVKALLALGLRCSRAMKPASERMCSHHSGAPWPGQASAPACASPASTRAMPVAVGAHQRMGAAAPRCIRR